MRNRGIYGLILLSCHMSKALLYLEILNDPPQHYEKSLFDKLKIEIPEADYLDLDNFSDPLLISYAIEMIRRSDKIVIVIEAVSEITAGKLFPLFENIIKEKNKCLTLLKGKNPIAAKMLQTMGSHYVYTEEESLMVKSAVDFLS
jgi:hypothetical protein